MTDVFIRRIYEYKGIKVAVDIDLEKKQISLVEKNNGQWQKKKWRFTERSLEYMNGWKLILQAMEYAITEASKELELAEKRDEEKFMELIIGLHDVVQPKKGKK